jgi:hypothetical protein
MAIISWRGDAAAVAKVVNLTVGGQPLPGDVFAVPMNGKTVQYVEGATATIADVVAGLQTALAASVIAEFQEVTWTAASPAVAGTAAAAGVPFTVSSLVLTPANLAVPVQSATSGTTGGTLTNGTTYFYVVTATNSNGETTKSNQQSYAATTLNPTAVLTWAVVPGAAGYKVYRSTTSNTYGATSLLATIGSGATVTYNDTGTATGAGQPPGSNGASSTATFVLSTPTASSGPNDVSVPANYSTGSLPVNGDSLYIQNTASSLLYGLSALSGVTLTLLVIDSTFTGTIGLPQWNTLGYWEYRPLYFQVGATTFNVLPGPGGGSGFKQINLGSVQTTANVADVGTPGQQGRPALTLLGTHAANVLNLTQGNVGSAIDPGDVSTWVTVNIGYQSSQPNDVTLLLGSGCTLTTINQDGGNLTYQSALTTYLGYAGKCKVLGTAATTILNAQSAMVSYQSSGTVTTATAGASGTIDCSPDPRGRIFTNTTIYGELIDPDHTVTHTNPVSCPNGIGGPNGATINWGTNFSIQRS